MKTSQPIDPAQLAPDDLNKKLTDIFKEFEAAGILLSEYPTLQEVRSHFAMFTAFDSRGEQEAAAAQLKMFHEKRHAFVNDIENRYKTEQGSAVNDAVKHLRDFNVESYKRRLMP